MKKEQFFYDSVSGNTRIHAVVWKPESEQVTGILQIAHGMAEYIERYEEFALYLNELGFVVAGNDHLGHGSSIQSEEDFGYFYKKEASGMLVRDMHTLRGELQKQYPGVPCFMLGHSMGSFVLRQYILSYRQGLDGVIIMGTGNQPRPLLYAGLAVTNLLTVFRGSRHRSSLINQMSFGSYNKQFRPNRTRADWLTKEQKIVDAYIADKRCSFIFTTNAYHNLFAGMLLISKKANIDKIPKDLPVFLMSGQDDPVGESGKAVQRLAEIYKRAGITELRVKLYPQDRHEILNETDRVEVYRDIYEWLTDCIEKRTKL